MCSTLFKLEDSYTPSYSYQLQVGDAIVIHPDNNYNSYFLIKGSLLMSKTFSNKEIVGLNILSKSTVINLQYEDSCKSNYYYKLEALVTTYILSFPKYSQIESYLVTIYHLHAVDQSFNLLEVFIHRKVKSRLVHLLLVISQLFGLISQQYIKIDLVLSHSNLAVLTGTNTNTISKLLKELQHNKLIFYKHKKFIIYDPIKLSYY